MPYGIIFMSEVLPTLILTAGGVAAFWIGTSTFLKLRRTAPTNELGRISESLDLLRHLSAARGNGLRSMVLRIQEIAAASPA